MKHIIIKATFLPNRKSAIKGKVYKKVIPTCDKLKSGINNSIDKQAAITIASRLIELTSKYLRVNHKDRNSTVKKLTVMLIMKVRFNSYAIKELCSTMLVVKMAPLSRIIRNKLVFNIVLSGFKKSCSLINKKPFSHWSKKSPYPVRKSRRLAGDVTYNINH